MSVTQGCHTKRLQEATTSVADALLVTGCVDAIHFPPLAGRG